jgi:metal-responsive CopG/Arc/MetJ family transcriptional regulator
MAENNQDGSKRIHVVLSLEQLEKLDSLVEQYNVENRSQLIRLWIRKGKP